MFQCPKCPTVVKLKSSLNRHLKKCHSDVVNDNWLQCPECPKRYPTEMALHNHKLSYHNPNRPKEKRVRKPSERKQCTYCPKILKDARRYYGHCNTEHFDNVCKEWVICDTCNSYFPTHRTVIAHKAASTCYQKVSSTTFQCEFCPKSFSRQYIYFRHASVFHLEMVENRWFKCEKCEDSYCPSSETLQMHVANAHKAGRKNNDTPATVLCSFCPESFFTVQTFYKHANKLHLDILSSQWIMCPECNFYLPTSDNMDKHTMVTHGERANPKYACQYCPISFTTKSRLQKHTNHRHVNEMVRDWYKCPDCSTYLQCEETLKRHRNAVHNLGLERSKRRRRKNKCPFCDRVICNIQFFYSHVNNEHPVEVQSKWQLCEHCESYLPSTQALKIHMSKKHDPSVINIQQLGCNYCPDKYTDAEEYAKHATAEHKAEISEKWHKCPDCDLMFPSQGTLKSHSEKHKKWPKRRSHKNAAEAVIPRDSTPDSKKCHFCEEEFENLQGIVEHANQDHFELLLMDWVACNFCSVYYPTKSDLKNHVQTCSAAARSSAEKSNQNLTETSDAVLSQGNRGNQSETKETFKVEISGDNHHHQAQVEEERLQMKAVKSKQPECHICHTTFTVNSSLNRHMSNVHGIVNPVNHNITTHDMNTRSSESTFQMKVRIKEEDLEMGKSQRDDTEPIQRKEKNSPQKPRPECWICHTTFAFRSNLNRHLKRSHGQKCQETDKDNGDLDLYPEVKMQVGESEDSNEASDVNDNNFNDNDDESKLECSVCHSKFTQMSTLLRHIRRAHSHSAKKTRKKREKQIVEDDSDNEDNEIDEQEAFDYALQIKKEAEEEMGKIEDSNLDEDESKAEDIIVYPELEIKLEDDDKEESYEEDSGSHAEDNWTSSESANDFSGSDTETRSGKKPSCQLCNKKFCRGASLYRHLRNVHHESGEKCDNCGHTHYSNGGLIPHKCKGMKSRNVFNDDTDNDNDDLQIKKENGVGDSGSESNAKEFLDIEFKDDPDDKETTSKRSSRSKKRRGEQQSFSCGECGKSYDKMWKLTSHKKKRHTDTGPVTCETCGKMFSKQEYLSKHIKFVHTKANFVKCDFCDKTFAQTNILQKHIHSVHLKLKFKCEHCDKSYSTSFMLRHHIEVTHTKTKSFVCDHCSKEFSGTMALKRHIFSTHNTAGKFDCDQCGENFPENSDLVEHFKSAHVNLFPCTMCDKSFAYAHVLKRHVKGVHLKEKPFSCEVCGMQFSEKHALNGHLRSVHRKEKNHKCDQCIKSFSELHVLKRHMQSVHLKERTNECEECGKCFSEPHVLKRHIMSAHLKERKFSCEVCGLSFAENHVLKRHMLSHEKEFENVMQ